MFLVPFGVKVKARLLRKSSCNNNLANVYMHLRSVLWPQNCCIIFANEELTSPYFHLRRIQQRWRLVLGAFSHTIIPPTNNMGHKITVFCFEKYIANAGETMWHTNQGRQETALSFFCLVYPAPPRNKSTQIKLWRKIMKLFSLNKGE